MVMGGDSRSEGREFESRHSILDGNKKTNQQSTYPDVYGSDLHKNAEFALKVLITYL